MNYDASVTWNENTYFDKKNNIANLLVNIIFCALSGVQFVWLRELHSVALAYCCGVIFRVDFSGVRVKSSSSRWT